MIYSVKTIAINFTEDKSHSIEAITVVDFRTNFKLVVSGIKSKAMS